MSRRHRSIRITGISVALSVCAGTALMAGAAPASADLTGDGNAILGNIPVLGPYVKQVEGYYSLAQNIIGDLTRTAGQLAPMQASLASVQANVISQIDALAVADVNGDADLTVQQFQTVSTMSSDQLGAFVARAVGVITHAKADLAAATDPKALDQLGFDINTIGPIALATSAVAGQTPAAIGVLKTDLVQANQLLLKKLTPNCGVSPDDLNVGPSIEAASNDVPGDLSPIQVTGRIACVNYKGPAPRGELNGDDGSVIFWPSSTHTAFGPEGVVGQGVADYTLGLIHSDSHVNWPSQLPNYEIPTEQAMAETSYPMAEAALRQLLPASAPAPGSSIAMAWSQSGPYTFALDPQGVLYSSGLATATASPGNWTQVTDVPGSPGASIPPLASIAATTTPWGVSLFGLDRIGQLYYSWSDPTGVFFSHWARMDGTLNSITAATNKNGSVQIFGSNSAGAVVTRSQVMNAGYVPAYAPNPAIPAADTWTGWETLASSGFSKVVAQTHSNGDIEVDGIAQGSDAGVKHTRQTSPNAVHSSGFTGWSSAFAGQGAVNDIAVSSDTNGGFVFYGVLDGNLFQNSEATLDAFNTGGWFPIANNIRNIAAYTFPNGSDTQLIGIHPDGTTVAGVISGGFMGGSARWGSSMAGATVRATMSTIFNPFGTPALVTDTDGRMEEFVTDIGGQIWHRVEATPGAGNWGAWQQMDGHLTQVAAAVNQDGRIELVGVNAAGNVFHRIQSSPGNWAGSSWTGLGGPLRSIAIARNTNGRLEIFGSNSSDLVYNLVQSTPGDWTGSAWSAPWDNSVSRLHSLAAAVNKDGRIELVGVNSAGVPFHRSQTSPGNWAGSSFTPFDGLLSSIAIARDADGRLEIFGTDSNDLVYNRVQLTPGDNWTGSTWSAPWDNTETRLHTVAAAARGNGLLEIFGVNSAGAAVDRAQASPGNWNGTGWTLAPSLATS